jgi:predicted dithiol-disulfide oxidoreductase (DUF899 family)
VPKAWPPGASAEYIAARTELEEAEDALLKQAKRVAALRRTLSVFARRDGGIRHTYLTPFVDGRSRTAGRPDQGSGKG